MIHCNISSAICEILWYRQKNILLLLYDDLVFRRSRRISGIQPDSNIPVEELVKTPARKVKVGFFLMKIKVSKIISPSWLYY